MSRSVTKITISWNLFSAMARATEFILLDDAKALKNFYKILESIEKQHPRKKALTPKRQELRVSNSPSANRVRPGVRLKRR